MTKPTEKQVPNELIDVDNLAESKAHGLKNQLGVIMGNLDFIFHEITEERLREPIRDAMNAAKKALALVDPNASIPIYRIKN